MFIDLTPFAFQYTTERGNRIVVFPGQEIDASWRKPVPMIVLTPEVRKVLEAHNAKVKADKDQLG
jgi:hypothetical protein